MDDILTLLNQKDKTEALFAAARDTRTRYFGNRVFLYGFIYISTYCRNNCNFCFYRDSNPVPKRYRKAEDQILDACDKLAESGVHLLDLTMGEDPFFFTDPAKGFDPLFRLVETVKASTHLPIMVSPGVVSESVLKSFADAGADWFACYQETHNRSLFSRLRPGQDYDARLKVKSIAHRLGMFTEEGILVGIGETPQDIAHSFDTMKALDVDQLRVMNFIPQSGTPMERNHPADSLIELIIIAWMRLRFPDKLIPATLDVEGLAGLKRRLDAGANVITSLVPPGMGLSGVAQSCLDIDEARRTPAGIEPVLDECGLKAAPLEGFLSWMKQTN
ncbi:MAG: methylornithine synthase PylB [Candidatus Omnitrophota bacterium]